jgi:outer membrane immunogenic protein
MKAVLLGTVLLAIAGPAVAADMPVKAPLAMKIAYDWSGYFAGVNGGYAKAQSGTAVEPGPSPVAFVNLLPQTLDPAPKGYFGGGQLGHNSQYGTMVYGWEADVQSGIKGTVIESPIIQNNGTLFPGVGNNITISQKLGWWGTGRLRVGSTFVDPRLLLFATAGVTFGQIETTANTDFVPSGTIQYPAALNEFRVGLVVGGARNGLSPTTCLSKRSICIWTLARPTSGPCRCPRIRLSRSATTPPPPCKLFERA